MESRSVGSFAGSLLEVSDCKHKDLYLYGSIELMVLFFELTTVYGLMCQINHLVLTLPHWLLHMLY